MYRIKGSYVVGILMFLILAGCQNQVEHTAPAIRPQDSVAMMTSYGVNTLVSDSGVMKYRIVTERWEVNTSKNPSLWIFDKGLLLEQFDEKFHINSYIQCDTAYYYDQQKIWKLYGRVSILTKDGLRFNSEQLTWDQNKHELSSNVFSKLELRCPVFSSRNLDLSPCSVVGMAGKKEKMCGYAVRFWMSVLANTPQRAAIG